MRKLLIILFSMLSLTAFAGEYDKFLGWWIYEEEKIYKIEKDDKEDFYLTEFEHDYQSTKKMCGNCQIGGPNGAFLFDKDYKLYAHKKIKGIKDNGMLKFEITEHNKNWEKVYGKNKEKLEPYYQVFKFIPIDEDEANHMEGFHKGLKFKAGDLALKYREIGIDESINDKDFYFIVLSKLTPERQKKLDSVLKRNRVVYEK